MVERQFGYPNLQRKIKLDVERSGSNRKFSDARAYRVCRTVEGSVWARDPVCATGKAAVPHVMKKTSASIARYQGSSCSCGQTGDRVCKEVQELVTQIVSSLPLQPSHDTTGHRKNGATSTVCVFPSLVTSLVFHSGAPRGFAKKLVQLRRHCPQSQCKYLSTFPVSTSSKSRPETSSPSFNSTCHFLARGDTAHRIHPDSSQEPEMVEFLPRLQLQRWTAEVRDVRVDAFFGVLTFCRIPDGTRIIRPFVVWFPPCVVQGQTLRKVVVSVRPTDVLVTRAR